MYISSLHNYWLTHLLALMHFGFKYVFDSLPYFLQSLFALLHCFFSTNYTNYLCFVFADLCGWHVLVQYGCLLRHVASFCGLGWYIKYTEHGNLFCGVVTLFLLLFCYSCVTICCCIFGLGLPYLCVLVCCFICLPVCFLVFFITITYSPCTVYPFFALYCSPWSSLVAIFVSATLLFFCTVCMPNKTSRSRAFWVLFASFFAFLLAPASIRAHPNSYVRACTHPHHFLSTPKKHDVRGNFPGHRDQIQTCETLNAPCLPCFCSPRAHCAPTHPSAPVHTHLHLHVPVCTLTFHVYVCNLIKKLPQYVIIFQIFIQVTSS